MKQLLLLLLISCLFFSSASPATAQAIDPISEAQGNTPQNLLKYSIGQVKNDDGSGEETHGAFAYTVIAPISLAITGYTKDGIKLKTGLLPEQGSILAMMYEYQPSSREYVADLLDNMGVPSVSRAYAQGTGYSAMSSFLPFWKVFRNLAYSLYIIMFVVVGVMIMLRTKVNAQTVITIQSALPNLLITLLLITFSYAIVGFMIDLMYFLIYFVVYLMSSIDIIDTPVKAISRLLNNSAWSVIFSTRDTIIRAVSLAITDALSGLGTGVLGGVGNIAALVSWLGLGYLIVAVWLTICMLKLMWVLVKCYFMLLVQTITAPMQILLNAVPGSKAFSTWLKTTASYLLPFPVVASMFIFAAILIGDPSRATIFQGATSEAIFGEDNPFGVNQNNPLYANYGNVLTGPNSGTIWLPPFTLTNYAQEPASLMVLLGFFIITMTPAAAKMAQEWMQVKESPYASEALAGFGGFAVAPFKGVISAGKRRWDLAEQRKLFSSIGKVENNPTPTGSSRS